MRLIVMAAHTPRIRTTVKGLKPSVMTKLRTLSGVQEVISFIEINGMLRTRD